MLFKQFLQSTAKTQCWSFLNRGLYINKKSTRTMGSKVMVNGVNLYYEKVGTGEHVVLLVPGALGSTKTDFKPQLENLNRDKFTVIGWDPRGYGQSRPPNRECKPDFIFRDAEDAVSLMENLGFETYSLLGWSDGANISAVMAARWSERVRKLVIWGGNSYFTQQELELYQSIRDLSTWSKSMLNPMVEVYGKEYFEKTWHAWIDMFTEMAGGRKEDTNLYNEELCKIKADTLIIHGQKDALVPDFHPKHFAKNIQNSRLVVWEDGKHNLHLRFADRFNELVQSFLLENTSNL
uniref:Valacyclovir hydrolase-like n=1 Tax=Ciona intestinalis TaxID=7719 RepID=F6VAC9_CIOIN|nr:valacyclovir hydrolase-like [Ciona intestinalis]|eukprot:XP_002127049.2 valacyclovir hydrolase-like [Ciona intestinalis]